MRWERSWKEKWMLLIQLLSSVQMLIFHYRAKQARHSLYPLKEENAKWTNRCRMTREGDDLTWLPPLSPRLCWEESNTSSLRLHPKVNRLLLMLPNPAGWQKMGFLKQMCNYQEKRKRETLYTSEMEFLKIKRMKTCTQTRESGSRLWNRTLFKKRQAGTLCPESTKY